MGEQMPTNGDFSPSDKQYRSVADLPEAIRDQFVDVQGGGFVRKSVREYEEDLERLTRENTISRYDDSPILKILATMTGGIRRRESAQMDGWMREHAEQTRPIDAMAGNADRLLRDQTYMRMWEDMKRRLADVGATGTLYVERDKHCNGLKLFGIVNDQTIDIHYCGNGSEHDGGKLGDVDIDRSTMDEIKAKYGAAAMSLDIFERAVMASKQRTLELARAVHRYDPQVMESKSQLASEEESRALREQHEEEQRRRLEIARRALFGNEATQ